jgi:hypothetical protein
MTPAGCAVSAASTRRQRNRQRSVAIFDGLHQRFGNYTSIANDVGEATLAFMTEEARRRGRVVLPS